MALSDFINDYTSFLFIHDNFYAHILYELHKKLLRVHKKLFDKKNYARGVYASFHLADWKVKTERVIYGLIIASVHPFGFHEFKCSWIICFKGVVNLFSCGS